MKIIQFLATAEFAVVGLCVAWAMKAWRRGRIAGTVAATLLIVSALLFGHWALNRPEEMMHISPDVELQWQFMWWPLLAITATTWRRWSWTGIQRYVRGDI